MSPSSKPSVNGHYSPAVVHAGLVYTSGQLGRTPTMTADEAGDIEAQTRRAFASLAAVLESHGSGLGSVLKLTVYLSDVSDWPAVNAICAESFGKHRPARSIVPTGPLHFGALIEVEAIAAQAVRS